MAVPPSSSAGITTKPRVRFAPSPTGYLHVGGARTALFNWLFARHFEGTLVLRIEDTDLERSTPEMVEGILQGLQWLGLSWDEGPYYQTQRVDMYRAAATRLIASGAAYYCFCSKEELEKRRVEAANAELEDFVLLRSDGSPTYHLSVVADDIDLRITHIIRGADHISNTPKQVLLYRALATALPVFAHVPLILGPDKTRLSKRHGATSVIAYREEGIVPEAFRNFLALLGWTPPEASSDVPATEILGDQELI